MTDSEVKFDRLSNTSHPAMPAVLEIYTEAFPASERLPIPVLKERVDRGIYELWRGQQGDRVVFLAVLYPFPDSDLTLLGYIATHRSARNQGIGSQFLRQILAELQQRDRYLLLEVELPVETDPMSQRRCEFYRRFGAVFLEGVRYILPPLSGGEPTEMCLAIASEYAEPTLSGDRVRSLLRHFFQDLYDRPANDPLLLTCLETVPDTVYLK